jgi:hypothetical protein
MTKGKKFKRRVLERMGETGESYQAARTRLGGRPAESTRVDTLGILDWCAERREQRVRDGWVVAAESVPTSRGIRWDVRAEHVDGSRVPPGTNLHEDPAIELRRLFEVIGA